MLIEQCAATRAYAPPAAGSSSSLLSQLAHNTSALLVIIAADDVTYAALSFYIFEREGERDTLIFSERHERSRYYGKRSWVKYRAC